MTRDCVWNGDRTEMKGEQPLQIYHRREKGANQVVSYVVWEHGPNK